MEISYVDLIFGSPEQIELTTDKLETIIHWDKQLN